MFGVHENIFATYVKLDKLYRKICFDAVTNRFGNFTANEVLVLMFLSNEDNAPLDTARDISEFRKISKSMVAKSIDSLTRRGLIVQERDEHDRRIIHLRVTDKCADIARCIADCRTEFIRRVEKILTNDDRASMRRVAQKIDQGLDEIEKGVDCDD